MLSRLLYITHCVTLDLLLAKSSDTVSIVSCSYLLLAIIKSSDQLRQRIIYKIYKQLRRHCYILGVVLYTVVEFKHMAADEPHQVWEIWRCGLVSDVPQHAAIVNYNKRILHSQSPMSSIYDQYCTVCTVLIVPCPTRHSQNRSSRRCSTQPITWLVLKKLS